MKIAHLICRFPPYYGGMGRVAFEQVNRLTTQGHQVTVFTLAPTCGAGFTLSQPDKLDLTKYNFEIKYLKAWPRFGNGGFCPQLLRQLKDYDVVQLHYPFFGAQEILWLTKKLKLIRAKIVIFYHMDATFSSWLLKLLSLKSLLIRANLFKTADKICCASLDYVQHSKIRKIYKINQHKFIEIPFGSNQSTDNFNLTRIAKIKQQHQLTSDNKIVLFVGSLDAAHYFKGVPVLINAVHKLNNKNTKLIIVGNGNLQAEFIKQAEKLNIIQQVIFANDINDQDLANYYYLSDVVVLPSTTPAEAFGLVLVEAKTFAKPVIGSNLPGVRGVVGQSGLVVQPGSVDDLADKINKILSDSVLAEKLGKLAQQEVVEKYNWEKHVTELNSIYTALK